MIGLLVTDYRLQLLGVLLLLCVFSDVHDALAQDNGPNTPPPYIILRAEENYEYLRNGSPFKRDIFDPIKFISLNRESSAFLTFGGELRPRFRFVDNENWGTRSSGLYSQRISLHGALTLGPRVRFFSEFYHGLLSIKAKGFTEDDNLDVHQGFIESQFPLKNESSLRIRIGRQELSYGSARLVGIREGPNMRRSFDAARIVYRDKKVSLEGFLGSEVVIGFEAFDNKRNEDMIFWGFFTQVNEGVLPGLGASQFYFFTFDVQNVFYQEGQGEETRYTLGFRRFGKIGASFQFNSELMVQFGTFGSNEIFAAALQTDFYYGFYEMNLKPVIGLKVDYISGDREMGDGKLNTFNPFFANPTYFGLITQIAPINLFDIHPSLKLEISDNVELVMDWDIYWRANESDGVYAPPRFLTREGQESQSRFIGHQIGTVITYQMGRHITWSTEMSYFVPGSFVGETGPDENIFYLASTLSFKF